MSRKHLLVLLAAVFASAPAAVAQDFEGVVKLRTITVEREALSSRGFDDSQAILDLPMERILALRAELEPGGEMMYSEMETTFKGNLIRSDARGEDMVTWVVMNVESGTIQVVQPAEQMIMEMTSADMERMAAMGGGMPDQAGEMDITETGLSREINGFSCVAYDVSDGEETTRVWVSNDDPRLTETFRRFGEANAKMSMGEEVSAESLVAKFGFPVLTQRLTYDMYDVNEVVSFERGAVSSDVFELPAGYRKINMAQMMGIGR